MKVPIRVVLAAAAAVFVAPQAAWANPPSPQPCANALTMVGFPGYVTCRGAFGGNINGAASELTALAGYFGGTWLWRGKSDDGVSDGPAFNSNGPFTSGPTAGPTGTIGFDSPISGNFVVGIKQCDLYSWYLYQEGSPISSIAIDSRGTCVNDGFSHVALYTGSGGGTTLSVTPEPATMTLFATGLIGMVGAGIRRRKRR